MKQSDRSCCQKLKFSKGLYLITSFMHKIFTCISNNSSLSKREPVDYAGLLDKWGRNAKGREAWTRQRRTNSENVDLNVSYRIWKYSLFIKTFYCIHILWIIKYENSQFLIIWEFERNNFELPSPSLIKLETLKINFLYLMHQKWPLLLMAIVYLITELMHSPLYMYIYYI